MSTFQIDENQLKALKGKVAVLTGSSSGIGLETLKLFVENGATVVNADLKPPADEYPNTTFIKTDVTKWEDLRNLFQETVKRFGRVDVTFANAGVATIADYFDLQVDDLGQPKEPSRLCYEINVIGLINTRLRGANSELTGYMTFGATDYTTSKHSVLGFQRGVLPQLRVRKLDKIRLNSIAPNWTRTNLLDAQWLESIGVKFQDPSAVARAVGLLAADEARNGQVIYIENGNYREIEKDALACSFQLCNTLAEGNSHAQDDEVFEEIFKNGQGRKI
ncbi:putative oxidoreductase,short chain dehydrogenase [Fonsecaea pedrosoi]|nr:putative oxidoreductase,short chain dehydrogenase [Fonsecaea pedrosoi]